MRYRGSEFAGVEFLGEGVDWVLSEYGMARRRGEDAQGTGFFWK